MGRLAKAPQGQLQPGMKAYKAGGSVKHTDAAEDKKLIGKMIKEAEVKEAKKELKGLKCGGKAKK